MDLFCYFLLWNLILYWTHWLGHRIPYIRDFHLQHHKRISYNLKHGVVNRWHWSNIFLFNDDWTSTIDYWITEIIPTLLFCMITGQWWIMIVYYFWAAFIQESVEHNPKINLPFMLSGHRHVLHHKKSTVNYGVLFPIWDKLFGTLKNVS